MSDVAALAPKIPQQWQRALLPFIQRSAEFEQVKQPLIGYYLLQYVASIAMKLHKSPQNANKGETTPFIIALLDVLESKKTSLSAELAEADGRTEVSRAALALFSRADDDERRGVVSEAIVKLFYSASLLFEATKQFMDDEQMDPFAAEKHRYAQVVAARMKKSLTNGTPYESPSGAKERPVEGQEEHEGENEVIGGGGGGGATHGSQQGSSNAGSTSSYGYVPPPPPAAPPAAPSASSYSYSPAAVAPPPPSSAPPAARASSGGYNYQPPAPAAAPPAVAHQQPPKPMPPPPQPQAHPAPTPTTSHAAFVNTYVPPAAPTGQYNPNPNDMIDAQKYAKLAVSALQFYDHVNARKQLLMALQHLDGQAGK